MSSKPRRKISVTVSGSSLHGLSTVKADTEKALRDFFDHKRQQAETFHVHYHEYIDVIESVLFTGGKRIRPYMTVLAYESYGGAQYRSIVQIAAAQELLHYAMLIHDDIMDRELTRRGMDNVAGRYQRSFEALGSSEASHQAMSIALLAGDTTLSGAFELIAKSGFSAQQCLAAQQLLQSAIYKTIGGQLLDNIAMLYQNEAIDPLLVARAKTAFYSFVIPLQTGAHLAGANEDELAHLEQLGLSLGLAFQLVDDVLCMFGKESVTGKSNLSDIREGKRHYMYAFALSHLEGEEREFFVNHYGQADISQENAERVRSLIEVCGALHSTKKVISDLTDISVALVESLAIGPGYKVALYELIDKTTKRKK